MVPEPTRPEREKAREAQCPNRRGGCCDLINARLGWRHGCPIGDCDTCWTLGTETDAGLAHRDALFQKWLAYVKANWRTAPPEIVRVLIRDHMTPEEIAQVEAEKGLALAETRSARWRLVSSSWDQALSFCKSLKSRGFTGKRAELTVKGRRMMSCFGDGFKPACTAMQTSKDGDHHYCADCGCGDKPMAWLDHPDYPKLDYPYLECPRGMPGFSNEGRIRI